jgi:hypothetical protein
MKEGRRTFGLAVLCWWALACNGPAAHPPDAAAPECRPPAGVSGAPRSIAEAVTLANALPHPLSLPCFVASLDRPLGAQAVVSTISLQPAVGERSPRIFLFSGPLVMSVAPEGVGRALVELGQLVGDARSLKGELGFPIAAPLDAAEPFARVHHGDGTTCGFCHPGELRAADIADAPAFVSGAFRPAPRARVDLATVRHERALCDPAREPERCALLGALFDHGEVVLQEFPPTVPFAFTH